MTDGFFASEAGQQLGEFVRKRIGEGGVVYPPQPLRALELTPLADVRVVILGQDPYHGPGQAEGLAFSVAPGEKIPRACAISSRNCSVIWVWRLLSMARWCVGPVRASCCSTPV